MSTKESTGATTAAATKTPITETTTPITKRATTATAKTTKTTASIAAITTTTTSATAITTKIMDTFSLNEPISSQQTLKLKILNHYPVRLLTLFFLGALTSFIIDHLLTQNHITEYPKNIVKLIDTAAWIPPTCGASAALVGSLFPLVDYWYLRRPHEFQKEWSDVMR